MRPELRYRPPSWSLPRPEGVTVTAAGQAGVVEIRIPEPDREPARKIAISKA